MVDHEAAAGRASLPGRGETTPQRPGDRLPHVGVIEDDEGVLAPHLQRDAFELGAGRGGDLLADRTRPGERHHVDVGMSDQRLTHLGPVTRDQVGDPGGHSGLREDLEQAHRGVGGVLGRLDHDGVATDQRREQLPSGHPHRQVPWCDDSHNAHRLPDRHRKAVWQARWHGVAEHATSFPRHVLAGGDGPLDVVAGVDEHLAHLPGDGLGQFRLALDQHPGGPSHDFSPEWGRGASPLVLGSCRRAHRSVDILGTAPLERSDHVVGPCRVGVEIRCPARRGDPVAVDVVERGIGHGYSASSVVGVGR